LRVLVALTRLYLVQCPGHEGSRAPWKEPLLLPFLIPTR
jgi:hypothetical protein